LPPAGKINKCTLLKLLKEYSLKHEHTRETKFSAAKKITIAALDQMHISHLFVVHKGHHYRMDPSQTFCGPEISLVLRRSPPSHPSFYGQKFNLCCVDTFRLIHLFVIQKCNLCCVGTRHLIHLFVVRNVTFAA
jgi:hypothetical protein